MTELLLNANALSIPLADASVDCCITSPPYYGLRDYQVAGQLGLEATPEQYVANMVAVFREVWRVLKPTGTLWLNIGDSYTGSGGAGGDYAEGGLKAGQPRYKSNFDVVKSKRDAKRWGGGNLPATAGLKPKDLIGIPWMLAFALRADGWYLRSDIIWSKPNPMPESVTDRPTKSHEYLFLLSKSRQYFYDADAVREAHKEASIERDKQGWNAAFLGRHQGSPSEKRPHSSDKTGFLNPAGRNRRSVWNIATQPYAGAHFATFPVALVNPCIKAGTSERGVCPQCGKPWERVVEKNLVPTKKAAKTFVIDKRDNGADAQDQGSNRQKDGHKSGYIRADKTIGWQPTCEHIADPVPAIVLDPFAGSGTTLLAARMLGRNAVGLDLSFDYLHDQARPRLELDQPALWEGARAAASNLDDLPMFSNGAQP
jgi:DNA modification methylase